MVDIQYLPKIKHDKSIVYQGGKPIGVKGARSKCELSEGWDNAVTSEEVGI